MADEQGRWFKVFASITESDVFGDAQALRCWIWCLKSANWKPQMCKRQMFPRGTFWCNIREAAAECRCAVKTWDQAIEHLVKLGMVSVVRSPKCITITVTNYDRFQSGIVVATTTNGSTNGSTNGDTNSSTVTTTRSRSPRLMKTEVEGEGAAVAAPPAPVDPPKPAEPKPRKVFIPPTMDEAKAYAKESIPVAFSVSQWWDYYASKGWRVGSHLMVDWRAAMRRWAREEAKRQPKSGYDRPSTPPSVIPGLEWMVPKKKEPNQ
jgi:hypothetical protein